MRPARRFSSRLVCFAVVFGLAGGIAARQITAQEKEQPKVGEKQPQSKQPEKTDEGRARLLEAYELTKTAASPKEYTQIIELCEKGVAATESASFKTYGQKLAAWAHYKRGEALAGGSPPKDKEALADFDAAVKLLENVPGRERPDWEYLLLHHRGVSHAMSSDYDKALADFNRVIELRPTYGKEYFNRAEIHYAKGDFARAIADYDQAIRTGYTDSVVYTRRGTAYFKQENVARALTDYNQAIARNPLDYEAFTFRGDAYAASGNHAQAVRDYQRAMTLNDRYARAYFSAAWLRATCPDPRYRDAETALRSARRAIELEPENYRYLECLAAAQARAGQFDQAIATQKKAIEVIPKDEKEALETAQSRLALYEKKQALVSEEPSGGTGRKT